MSEADVLILGGGPAGAAAAIVAAGAGARVTLFEGAATAARKPGETLHPGVEPLLCQLGVAAEVESADFLRHDGQIVRTDGRTYFVPYGEDERGPWRGYQASRVAFDQILLDRARAVGVDLRQPAQIISVSVGCRRVDVSSTAGPFCGRYVVDATGHRRILARAVRLPVVRMSPRRIAWYGYAEGICPVRDAHPAFAVDGEGWTWTARVSPGRYHWTRVWIDSRRPPSDWLPAEFSRLRLCGPRRGADVGSLAIPRPAGRSYFFVGDAAAVLDPASAHGVLRALMSGMMAGDLIARVLGGTLVETEAAQLYEAWLRRWVFHDAERLREFYAKYSLARAAGPTSPDSDACVWRAVSDGANL